MDPDAATTAADAVDPPAGSDDAGDTGGGNDLATLVRTEVVNAFNSLMGRDSTDDDGAEPDNGDGDGSVAEPVTAKGKTAAARAARPPTREQSVAEETRAELERIRSQERDDDEKKSMREEIEGLKGQVTALAEKPPEQYNRVTKALWG